MFYLEYDKISKFVFENKKKEENQTARIRIWSSLKNVCYWLCPNISIKRYINTYLIQILSVRLVNT